MLFKLFMSIVVGYLIGTERKKNEKSGGSRTMAIVCLSATLIAILTLKIDQLDIGTHNFSRLMAYGIAGISFIGNGIIIHYKDHVEGLTTASSLFAVVILGYFIGLGFYFTGIIGAVCVYFILESKYWRKNESK